MEPANTPEELYGLVHGSTEEFTIIDGGPADPDALQTIARLSHRIILPTEPSMLVAEQVTPVVEYVNEVEEEQGRKIPCQVLLVRVMTGSKLTGTVEDALSAVNISMMKTRIPNNGMVTRAAHTVPTRLYGYEFVAEELLAA
ncbi:hypothetical protein BS329_38895 [Amycolatopsis coloradensis]|uniref:Uncharacterized protein n=1 Tax=Amycolatopsis coloradensis TaxID=76021 RepID=A0A1R0KEU0_9PSEU|nr:hypothetical protein BS329_38895 [Amycolatopsis coloradensis]